MTTAPDDLIDVATLPPALRQYCKRWELEAGTISRRVLVERQRGAEGRVVADARSHGSTLPVAERHAGERIATTAATAELDLGRSVRVR